MSRAEHVHEANREVDLEVHGDGLASGVPEGARSLYGGNAGLDGRGIEHDRARRELAVSGADDVVEQERAIAARGIGTALLAAERRRARELVVDRRAAGIGEIEPADSLGPQPGG